MENTVTGGVGQGKCANIIMKKPVAMSTVTETTNMCVFLKLEAHGHTSDKNF